MTPGPTGPNEIQYFNTSLMAVRQDNEQWRQAFDAIAEYPYAPDVIAVLEVPWARDNDIDDNVPNADRGEVLSYIEQRFGSVAGVDEFGSVHVDGNTPACQTTAAGAECGNTMIVFRLARFDQQGTALRWRGLQDDDTTIDCTDENTYVDQIAVSLRDKLQSKTVVVVGLHLHVGSPKECVGPNLKVMNDKVEYNFSNRPMTIVSGDLNEHPDPRHMDESTAAIRSEWRNETRLACWYKRMSQYHADDGCSITVGSEFSFPYYDAISTHHTDDAMDICDQWTFNNKARGTAPDDCTLQASSNQKRLDYLWVRYEKTSTGTAITPAPGSKAYPLAQIADASTDDGLYGVGEVKYSDHRILQARFLWCGLTTPTPCDP